MKKIVTFFVSVVLLTGVPLSSGRTFVNTTGVVQAFDASIEPAMTMIAAKKKSSQSGGKSAGDIYARAWELCRQKYGRSEVISIRIRPDGMVICYVDAYSPGSRGNYNQRK